MKKHLFTVLALAFVLILAACQSQNQPAAPGSNQTDPLPSHVQQTDPTDTILPADPVDGESAAADTASVAPAPAVPAEPAPADPKQITMDEAIAIALKDAGFTEKDVVGQHAELDRDDGVTYYDVDFYKDGKEYDYEIHAETGKILKPVTKSSSSGSSSSSSSSSGSSSSSKNITKDDAISKALSHAGLKKSQVSRLQAKLDRDDGVTLYEVEFRYGNYEYDYEIHATSGKVLKAEKDRDD